MKVSHTADAATVTRFQRESYVLEKVGAPHVPALVASGTLADGRVYLAMQRLAGRTLADEMSHFATPPDAGFVASLASVILEATAALHGRGVFHRDLKPENIFLIRDDGVQTIAKLVDFGLALAAPDPGRPHTATGVAAGTPEYMSPERIAGHDGDLRSDVYALGVILFELVTLRPPFVGDRSQIEYAHLSFRPPRPSRFAPISPPLEDLILRCLAKEPDRRFIDAVELQRAFLEAITETKSDKGSSTPASEDGPTTSRSTRQRVGLVFISLPTGNALDVQAVVRPLGGQLAHLAADRCVCAFSHRAGDHPGRRALAAAEALVGAGLARRLVVDVATVTVKPRPRGQPRVSSSIFSDAARFPQPDDPESILLTTAAQQTLPGLTCQPAAMRPGYFVVIPRSEEDLLETVELTALDRTGLLFGRDEHLRRLFAQAHGAITQRRPFVASALGEPGLGKTRLRFELANLFRTEMPEAEILEIGSKEPLGHVGDEALARILRWGLRLPRQPPQEGALDLLTRELGEPKEAAAAGLILGWLSPDAPAVRSLRAAPGVLRANAARAGMAALRRVAQQRPVLVLLDDAHWADHALLEAIEQTTVSQLPLWVCALARPEFAASRPSWGQRALGGSMTLHLAPLDRTSAAELCRSLLEPVAQVPQPVVDRLVDRTEGVPLLIHDLIRGLRREGLVQQQSGGVWVVVSAVLDKLSESPLTEWMAGRELDALPAELAAHARLLSLLASEFTIEDVEGVMAEMDNDILTSFPMDPRVGTEKLCRAGLVARRPTGRYTFRTELMKESVARTVHETMAVRIHEAALSYQHACPTDVNGRLSLLAWHAAALGRRKEAAAAYLTLAESARERHSYLEGELLYTRCLGQLAEGDLDERLRTFRGRGIMRYRLGRHDDSLADFAEARAIALAGKDPVTQAEVLLDEAMALDWLFDWSRSRELTDQARALFPEGAPPALEARLLLAVGRSLHRFNRDEEATSPLREAERLAEAAGDEGYEVRVIADILLGLILPLIGRPDEAEERLRRVQMLCEEKGDELHLAVVWQHWSCLWLSLNNLDRFVEDRTRAQEYARRLGNANLERSTHHNSAYFHYWRGEHDAALPAIHRMIELDERCFRQEGFRPDGALLLARILWAKGAELDAARTIENVRRHQAEARAEGQTALLIPPNDEMLLDMTTLLVEGADAGAWEALVARARQVAQGQELIEVLELAGVAAERRGELAGARRWWQEAVEVGQRIPNVMGERIRQRLEALASAAQ